MWVQQCSDVTGASETWCAAWEMNTAFQQQHSGRPRGPFGTNSLVALDRASRHGRSLSRLASSKADRNCASRVEQIAAEQLSGTHEWV
jgi:hypothetical protein